MAGKPVVLVFARSALQKQGRRSPCQIRSMVAAVAAGVMAADGAAAAAAGAVLVAVAAGAVMRHCLVRNDGGSRDVEVLLDVTPAVPNSEVETSGKGCPVAYEEASVPVDRNHLYIAVGPAGALRSLRVEH